MSFDRCSICNAVSSSEIATNPEDFRHKYPMTVDPRDDTAMVCYECKGVLGDLQTDYNFDDEEDEEDEDSEFYNELFDE